MEIDTFGGQIDGAPFGFADLAVAPAPVMSSLHLLGKYRLGQLLGVVAVDDDDVGVRGRPSS